MTHPLRVVVRDSGTIHAATSRPAEPVWDLLTACNLPGVAHGQYPDKVLRDTTPITCTSCKTALNPKES